MEEAIAPVLEKQEEIREKQEEIREEQKKMARTQRKIKRVPSGIARVFCTCCNGCAPNNDKHDIVQLQVDHIDKCLAPL